MPADIILENQEALVTNVTRAEWLAFLAFLVSIGSFIFGLGVVYADVQDHERRLSAQENKMEMLGPRVERIDANVAFLAERAREDRARQK